MQICTVRHNADFIFRDHIYDIIGNTLLLTLSCRQTGAGSIIVKNLNAAGTDIACIADNASINMVCCFSGLFLRRPGQLQHHGLMCKRMEHLYGITDRIDIRVACTVVPINQDCSPLVQSQSGLPCKGSIRPDSNCHNDCFSFHNTSGFQQHIRFLEFHDLIFHDQFHAFICHFFLEDLHHIVVIGTQDLGHRLYQGHLIACFPKIYRHFYADKPASYHRYLFHISCFQECIKPVNIHHVLDGEKIGSFDSFNWRNYRISSGR